MDTEDTNLSHAARAAATPSSIPEATVLRVPGWEQFAWLRHGFSTRAGGVSTIYRPQAARAGREGAAEAAATAAVPGDLNLGWTPDDSPELVAENRHRFMQAVWANRAEAGGRDAAVGSHAAGIAPPTLITVRQVHSAVSLVVAHDAGVAHVAADADAGAGAALVAASGRALCEGDGLITAATGLLLGVQTADCVPVLVVDTVRRVVAGFHAGWRGTVARIVEQGVARMQREFGSRAEDMMAAIGPAIGACCYTVGDEVHDAFHAGFDYAAALFHPASVHPVSVQQTAGAAQYTVDLREANRRQLLAAGITAARITVLAECTACAGLPQGRRYFSHRAEHGFTGRMLSAIGITAAWHAR